jgi:SAM-dependent methyltransferase
LVAFWREEEQRPFTGWDFSYIKDRMIEEPLPWSYEAIVRELMVKATAVLDTSTGAGEKLLGFRDLWPPVVKATVGYEPNLALARQNLEPFGAEVLYADGSDSEILPFPDESFDLVLNRHGGLNCDEVARVLKPGGTFLTQQVSGMSEHDLIAVFTTTGPKWSDANPEKYVPWLEQAGLQIVRVEQHNGRETFSDVGAVVYHLKAIPWLVEGFSVDTHLPQLWQLQEKVEAGRPLAFSNKRYLIQAHKS